jgi:Trp operon repressor
MYKYTQRDVDDAMRKGRMTGTRGETSGTHKLSSREAAEILEHLAQGHKTQMELENMYNVSQSTMSLMHNRKRWK